MRKRVVELARGKGFVPKTVSTKFTFDYLLGGKDVVVTELCIHLLFCEIQKWLREYCDVDVLIKSIGGKNGYYIVIQRVFDGSTLFRGDNYFTFEQALEIGVKQALELSQEEQLEKIIRIDQELGLF